MLLESKNLKFKKLKPKKLKHINGCTIVLGITQISLQFSLLGITHYVTTLRHHGKRRKYMLVVELNE